MSLPRAAERVWAVVRAGRRIADPADQLGRQARRCLPEASGLSAAGVALALERLEIHPAAADIDRLVRRAGPPVARCQVVLAANVCSGALRALCCAVAAAEQVQLRPSRRDPVLAELLVQALQHDEPGLGVELVDALAPRAGDLVQLYGSDEALQAISEALVPGALVQRFGTGLGVALVTAEHDTAAAARAIAEDVIVFDQRGCLSPRFVLVAGDEPRAARIAEQLHRELDRLEAAVPRGPLAPAEEAELTRHRQTCAAVGRVWAGRQHLVTLDPAPEALLLPPPVRCVHVAPVSAGTVEPLLEPWRRYITIVGGTDEGSADPLAQRLRRLVPHARLSALGAMQSPPLDGPVDLRATRRET